MTFVLIVLAAVQISRGPDCPDVRACRAAALEAASQHDYETFHDLAWRAVQKGRPNDPDLMYLLARAQSLSGRPGDALVMLERLANMGVITDAATDDDFQGVRARPGWKSFVEGLTRPTTEVAVPAAAPPATVPVVASSPARPSASGPEETAIHFVAAPFVPAGLAYDAVSRRFVVGDRRGRRLLVVDEPSHHVATLVSAPSAGFADITALEIDRHEGDLWVASADDTTSTLHKLQLVSGRLIYAIAAPQDAGAVRFVDVAVAPRSTVLALDTVGRRLFALTRGSRTLHVVAHLDFEDPASVAPASEHVAYVAHASGIARVDLATRHAAGLHASRGIDLARLTRIRMHRGALVGIQKTAGVDRLVQIRLNAAGTAAIAFDVLADDLASSSEVTTSMTDDDLYYLSNDSGNPTVRRIKLR